MPWATAHACAAGVEPESAEQAGTAGLAMAHRWKRYAVWRHGVKQHVDEAARNDRGIVMIFEVAVTEGRLGDAFMLCWRSTQAIISGDDVIE